MSEVIMPVLRVLQPRDVSWKYTQNLQMHYVSGQSNAPEYRVRIANHYNYPLDNARATGRITFAVEDSYWQSNKLQAKEIYNADPHSLGQDTTLDGSYADLHGFKLESIVCGGYRDILIRVNGSSLTFDDVLEKVSLTYPSAA